MNPETIESTIKEAKRLQDALRGRIIQFLRSQNPNARTGVQWNSDWDQGVNIRFTLVYPSGCGCCSDDYEGVDYPKEAVYSDDWLIKLQEHAEVLAVAKALADAHEAAISEERKRNEDVLKLQELAKKYPKALPQT